jgi:hypothetical protein
MGKTPKRCKCLAPFVDTGQYHNLVVKNSLGKGPEESDGLLALAL